MATSRIEIDQDFQPLSEFRKHAADFIDRIKKQKRSIVLTQHGKSAAVLVDVSEYQRMVDKLDLMEELIEAERQIARGEVVSRRSEKANQRKSCQVEIAWTHQALYKLNKFVDYISRDDLVTAEKWVLKLIEKTDQLTKQPESGRIVPEYNEPNLRELIF